MDHSAESADSGAEPGKGGRDDASSATPNENLPATRGQGQSKAQGSKQAAEALFAMEPFFDRGDSREADAPRSRSRTGFAYGSHLALAVCVLGFAWAAGSYMFRSGAPEASLKTASTQAVPSQESVERAEILRTTQKLAEDVRVLASNVEALRTSLAQTQNALNQTAPNQRVFEKSLDGLKTRFDAAKTETSASIAELANKVERMQHEPTAKLQQMVDRLERIERQTAAPAAASPAPAVSALAKAASSVRPQLDLGQVKSLLDSAAGPGPKKPQLITSWVVRDVYDGIALVENAHGSLEVALGEVIPGAGTVKSIERRGAGWIVITSRGLVDSARGPYLP
ncbi:hypothetical protein [Methylocapsa aurea]|uniref:hypothetical protein n=1 Tax=Methylocapsa aurea TaxID=663610 RepID=UPI00055F395B|nr:hypothetical protein [Methylocapsa aurea]